jgi:hypothetical protein
VIDALNEVKQNTRRLSPFFKDRLVDGGQLGNRVDRSGQVVETDDGNIFRYAETGFV